MKIVLGPSLNEKVIEEVEQIVHVPASARVIVYSRDYPMGLALGDEIHWNLVYDAYVQIPDYEVQEEPV